MRYVLAIEPSGRMHGVAPPEVDLRPVGTLRVRRLSRVWFDSRAQAWHVLLLDAKGEPHGDLPGGPWATKSLAVEAEVTFFSERLDAGETL